MSASNDFAVSLGSGSLASGNASVAIGKFVQSTGDGSIEGYDIFTIPSNGNTAARIVCDIKNIAGICCL